MCESEVRRALSGFLQGDHAGDREHLFAQIVPLLTPPMLRTALRWLPLGLAEDAVQEVWVDRWQCAKERPEDFGEWCLLALASKSVVGFVCQRVTWQCLNTLRRCHDLEPVPEHELTDGRNASRISQEEGAAVARAHLYRLMEAAFAVYLDGACTESESPAHTGKPPPRSGATISVAERQFLVFMNYRLGGIPYAKLADWFNTSKENIRSDLCRFLEKIGEYLLQHHRDTWRLLFGRKSVPPRNGLREGDEA